MFGEGSSSFSKSFARNINKYNLESASQSSSTTYAKTTDTEEFIMSKLILELQGRRDQLQKNVEIHKNKRDKLNERTRKWAKTRDSYNKEIRELINTANEYKAKRDSINEEVQKHKSERNHINKEASDHSSKISELKRELGTEKGKIPIYKLKKELRDLEFKQMTSTLSTDKEKELIDRMKHLNETIKEREEKEQTPEIKKAQKELHEAKEKAEEEHKRTQNLADQAQEQHDKMLELFKKSEKLIKKADKAQNKFVESKIEADKEHNITMSQVKEIHELDRIIIGLKIKQKMSMKSKKEVNNRIEAKEKYKKFKNGEKLSTDDIMLLQKTGFL